VGALVVTVGALVAMVGALVAMVGALVVAVGASVELSVGQAKPRLVREVQYEVPA